MAQDVLQQFHSVAHALFRSKDDDDISDDDDNKSINNDSISNIIGGVPTEGLPPDGTKEDEDKMVDVILARELNAMSMEERNQVFHDLHGVSEVPDETHDFVQEKLRQLDGHLQDLIREDTERNGNNNNNLDGANGGSLTSAYQLAASLDPIYVSSEEFRLAFLRADGFQPLLAAKRILQFFQQKQELFPQPGLLVKKHIGLYDLSAADLESLHSGYVQILPYRDQGGRAVVYLCTKIRKYKHIHNLFRAVWYTLMTAARDETNQRLGMVQIVDCVGQRTIMDPSSMSKLLRLRQTLPIRVSAFHMCFDSPMMKVISSVATLIMSKESRLRVRTHYGNHQQVQSALQSFGIPPSLLPVRADGSVCLDTHVEWWKMQLELEKKLERRYDSDQDSTHSSLSSDSRKKRHFVPGYYDVLFGRGKIISGHPGNVRFHKIIDIHRDKYEQATKSEKGRIVTEIVGIVHNSSGRFLKREPLDQLLSMDQQQQKQQQQQQQADVVGSCLPQPFPMSPNSTNSSFSNCGSSIDNSDAVCYGHCWVEVDMEVAHEKVSQTFRTKRASLQQKSSRKKGGKSNKNSDNGAVEKTKRVRLEAEN